MSVFEGIPSEGSTEIGVVPVAFFWYSLFRSFIFWKSNGIHHLEGPLNKITPNFVFYTQIVWLDTWNWADPPLLPALAKGTILSKTPSEIQSNIPGCLHASGMGRGGGWTARLTDSEVNRS